MGPQLPLVDIPIRVIGVAVVGHEAHRAVFQQILIEPVAQIPVNHHDFSPAKAQGVSIGVPQIAERCFHLSASGAQVSLAGHLHAVRLKNRLPDIRHRHVKGYNLRLQSHAGDFLLQVLRRAQLLRTAAGADIGGILKNVHNLLCIHKVPSFASMVTHRPGICKPKEALNKSERADGRRF